MLSSFGAAFAASPEYASSFNDACAGKFGMDYSYTNHCGQTINHQTVHEAFEAAYKEHRGENLQRCGASIKDNNKIRRRFKDVIESDVKDSFHLSWATLGFAILLTLVGGPIGFIVAVIAVLFEYYLTKDLDGDKALAAAMA